MKTLGFILGAIALGCVATQAGSLKPVVANAGPIEPVGVAKARTVEGLKGMSTPTAMDSQVHHVKGVRPAGRLGYGSPGTKGRAIEIVYDNVTSSTGYAFAIGVGGEIGDDLHMIGGGLLQATSLSVYNHANPGTLTRVDIEVKFYDGKDTLVGSFLIDDLDLTDGGATAGLPPGYAQGWSITELAGEGITVPPNNKVTQVFSDVVSTGGPVTDLGMALYDPPDIGTSDNRFWLDSPDYPAGWYYFPGAPWAANFYYSVTVDKMIEPPVPIYSNITNPTGWGWGPADIGYWWGEDIQPIGGGVLKQIQLDLNYWEGPNQVSSFDLDIAFADINNPKTGILAGPFTVHFDLSNGPLVPGERLRLVITDLDQKLSPPITITWSTFVFKWKFHDMVGYIEGVSIMGPSLYDPPTVGSSGDMLWLEPPGGGDGWYWSGGFYAWNFYLEISVVELLILFPVTVLPDLGVPATFEVDPPDDSDPPQGGWGNPLTTPTYLLYDPPKDMSFRKPSLTVGGTPRKFLGWFFRALDPYYDVSVGPPDYQTTYEIGSDQYEGLEIIFNTELAVDAKKTDGTAQKVLVKFTDRPVDDGVPPPECVGDPIKDIDGLGDAVTPLLRKWNPIDIAAPEFDYNRWICHFVLPTLADGTPFLKYELTASDGTVSDFVPPTCKPPVSDPRVCLRVDAFIKAVAVYGTEVTYEKCDCNCDGKIDPFDIDPFVLALTDPAGYDAKWPDCDLSTADVNDDGKVDSFDIDPFVACLVP